MKVVITAGGVKEKIDEVRSITNSSSGKLGKKIAHTFLCREEVELIYIYAGIAEPIDDIRVKNIYIKDTNDFEFLQDKKDKLCQSDYNLRENKKKSSR